MKHTDLIIIGTGPGGYGTAVSAAQQGLNTVIIEAAALGGTCLNQGCIPTKCLCRNAQVLNDLKEGDLWGLTQLTYHFDIHKAMERKNEVVSTLQGGIQTLLSAPNITLVKGTARFVDAHTLEVENAHDATGEIIEDPFFSAPNIIIATGSTTKFLPIPGAHLPNVLTSTEMLDIDHIPQRLVVIGGGVIGMEFASIFSAFGSEVTVLEFCKEMLPNFDADLVKRMRPAFKKAGIQLVNQAAVTAIESQERQLLVHYDCKGNSSTIEADIVLMAVGRAARTEGLELEKAGIHYDAKGIAVDDNLQTNVPGVYAVGDVNGLCQLAHAASFQGQRALNHITQTPDQIRFDLIPAAIFTQPEAASVGLTEAACKERGWNVKTCKGFFRTNGKALAMGEPDGMVKLIFDEEERLIAGHIYGAHAADLIQELVPMIAAGYTLQQLRETIHAHPTLGEVILKAAH